MDLQFINLLNMKKETKTKKEEPKKSKKDISKGGKYVVTELENGTKILSKAPNA